MASTHKHIRSGTANKRPTTAIADGQIALNTNLSSPGLFFKDSTGAEILKIGPVHVGATAPNASPAGSAGNSTGEIWLDTSLTPVGVKIWNGSAFVNATPIGSTTVQGLLELATDAETQAGADTARAVTSASLQSKLSDSTSTTSNTTIASSTAVKAAYDLANAALPKTGGTVTGNLEIGTAGSLSFEGATADGFETTIAITDPTADRTITLPNTTGTVVTTGDTGTVTSTMILDGTIVDADINASAAIAYSKLASLTSANILVGNSSNVATSTAVTGDVTISNAGVTAISAGAIVNADVNASAAIAGSKISPDFGAQNVVTTGTSTAGSFTPTSTTVPAVGVYSPGANRLGITTNTVERVEFGTSEVVFNDDAADYDFRIEGDTNSNLFFADASAEAVGIRTATPVSELNVSVGNGGNITISNTNDAHSAGLAFGDTTSNSSGRISYDHSTNALAVATNGVERVEFGTAEVVFNDGGTDYDFRVEGDTSSHLLFVDASTDRVGIGTSSPSSALDISGAISLGSVAIPSAGTARIFSRNTDSNLYIQTGSGNTLNLLDGSQNTMASLGSSTVTFQTSNSPRLTITSTGLVGIGTTSPSEMLTLNNGNITIQGNTADRIHFSGDGTKYLSNTGDASTSILALRGRAGLIFNTGGDTTYNGGSEKARIDTSGRLLVGTATARSKFQISTGFGNVTPVHQFEFNSQTYNGLSITHNAGANTYPAVLAFGKSRGSSVNSYTAVASGDALGWLDFYGADGTNMVRAATISVEVDGTPGANDMPGRLVFSTTADGASSPTERMRIKADGDVSIVTGNLIIGTAGKGIDFSADGQAAGMTSELLDDYEEGTWTPSDGSGAGRTFTNVLSLYVKIGRQVTLTAYFVVDVSASSASFRVNGLPFASAATAQLTGTFGSSSGSAGVSILGASSSSITVGTPATYNTNLTNAQVSNAGVAFTMIYFV